MSSNNYSEKILYSFGPNGTSGDGAFPYGGVTVDSQGNLFGTTTGGGANGFGTVFELVNSSGTYSEKILYSFTANAASKQPNPNAGLIMDGLGNLYGTTGGGGFGYGAVFELGKGSGDYSLYQELYDFNDPTSGVVLDGQGPAAGLIMDSSGNLYDTGQCSNYRRHST